jgi:hypothetical protein
VAAVAETESIIGVLREQLTRTKELIDHYETFKQKIQQSDVNTTAVASAAAPAAAPPAATPAIAPAAGDPQQS